MPPFQTLAAVLPPLRTQPQPAAHDALIADLRRLARDLAWELNTAGPRLATILDQHQETKP